MNRVEDHPFGGCVESHVAHSMSCMELEQTIQSIKEMNEEDLEEALPRLLEKAVKADKALRVAQERLREFSSKQAKAPSFVEVHGFTSWLM